MAEPKKAAEDSQQSPDVDALLSLLLTQATEHALMLLSTEGRIVGWMAGSERIFGYTSEEILGQRSAILFTPEDISRRVHEQELRIARRDGPAEDDRWQVRKDGARIWASGVVVPLRDAQGEVIGFGKILRNRTDQKARIEALENHCDALAKADERKNIFLGTLAHELRNPLAPLSSAVDLIRMAVPDTPDVSFAITLIRRQVEFIKRLVDDLLDVTRIGAGKIQLEKEQVDLVSLLQSVGEACRPQIEERRQDFQVVLPETPITLMADPTRLRQVFLNLVNNASKYTGPEGQIWIKAITEEDEAVVRVADTGIGISAEMLPRIFEMFTQEESARAKAPEGLGIGLSLVKDLVALHGGKVLVRSDGRDKGSEFTVRLPLG